MIIFDLNKIQFNEFEKQNITLDEIKQFALFLDKCYEESIKLYPRDINTNKKYQESKKDNSSRGSINLLTQEKGKNDVQIIGDETLGQVAEKIGISIDPLEGRESIKLKKKKIVSKYHPDKNESKDQEYCNSVIKVTNPFFRILQTASPEQIKSNQNNSCTSINLIGLW